MAGKKGTLGRTAEAAGEAVQPVAAGAGLAAGPEAAPAESKPQPKAARKAAVARVQQAERDAPDAHRKASRRRASGQVWLNRNRTPRRLAGVSLFGAGSPRRTGWRPARQQGGEKAAI
jgi:hypothetical protein